MATKERNPPWNRDELTLALDLYVTTYGDPKSANFASMDQPSVMLREGKGSAA